MVTSSATGNYLDKMAIAYSFQMIYFVLLLVRPPLPSGFEGFLIHGYSFVSIRPPWTP